MSNPLVSILIVTYNRRDFFLKCVDSVISTTAGLNREIIIWDNCSTDGTGDAAREYAAKHDFLRYNISGKNEGVNGKSMAFEMAKGDFIACLDDDVIELPENWAVLMMKAFSQEPALGYLALDVVQNEHTTGGKFPEEVYREAKYEDDIVLQIGPAGGWVFMVPRRVYNDVGKLRIMKDKIFFGEDEDYVKRCEIKGYIYGILKNVKCFHATGPYYNSMYRDVFDNKMKDYQKGDWDSHRLARNIKLFYAKVKRKIFGKR